MFKRRRDPEAELQKLYDAANDREAVRRDAENASRRVTEITKREEESRKVLVEHRSDGAVSEAEESARKHPDSGSGGRKKKHPDSGSGDRKKKHPDSG